MNSDTSTHWDGYALSQQQECLIARKRSTLGFASIRIHIDGVVNVPTLQQTLDALVEQFELLRTTYRSVQGDEGAVLMAVSDPYSTTLVTLPSATEEIIAADLAECTKQSCLDDDEPLKARIYQHENSVTTLVLLVPELSVDQQSCHFLYERLMRAYEQPETVPDKPIVHYIDYAQWQFEQIGQEGGHPLHDTLKGEEGHARIQLPLASNGQVESVNKQTWELSPEESRKLEDWAQSKGVSLEAVMQACWLAAVYRCSALPEKLTMMVPHSGRVFEELETAIGLFESYFPLMVAIPDSITLEQLAKVCDQKRAEIHQVASQGAVGVYRSGEKLPSEVGFAYYQQPSMNDSHWQLVDSSLANEGCKLHLQVQRNETLSVCLKSQSDGFELHGVDALRMAFSAMMTACTANTGLSIQEIRLLSTEQTQALFDKTNGAEPHREDTTWLALFEQSVREYPDKTAIRFNGRQWSYREINEFTSQLATYFSERGVEHGSVVGLQMERSDMALASMVALHKCGAAYAPMDPGLPAHRQETIVEQLGLKYMIVDESVDILTTTSMMIFRPLNDLDEITRLPTEPSLPRIEPQTPAYVLYTSGSTGTPKGVIVHHDALANYVMNIRERASLSVPMTYLSVGPLYTDLGNTTLFPALCTGGAIDLAPFSKAEEAQELIRYMESTSFDVLKITPSHLTSLFALSEQPTLLMPTSVLLLGGEVLSWGMAKLIQSFSRECRLFNHYGPTETCVGVASGEVDFAKYGKADVASTVPLGRPLSSARCYIVDNYGHPVPLGVAGELYIGGNTVALGYVDSTEATQDKFDEDPWSLRSLSRLYRSGDRARFLPDGQIEFLGRMDRQVKVRGFRVEPAEIEACLCEHESVIDARVVEHGESGSKHLLAYVVMNDERSQNEDWLRDVIAQYVPEFMVPKQVVSIPRFPLTASGKLDVHSLPDPDAISKQVKSNYIAPISDVELRLAELFKSLLLLNQVSVEDDFFEVGGHSLIATKLVAAIRKEFNIKFSLRSVFMDSTLGGLSKAIEVQLAQ
ncbi:non-ribosomal peptide synthetase [Vibrio coralliilyticus]|uniref:non-ribosomal peptide synthetase n=1 Tax=Vibrio coralliilyticus TaxID=190893 RepID=UPI000C166BEA|nr:non-ribosomal peptide synthetase [Vibrio coralliilyticus]